MNASPRRAPAPPGAPRPTILDGGMGQELVRRSARPPTPLWSSDVLLHEPALVAALHADYIDAGADVITLASYTATPERLARDGAADRFEALQRAAADCALEARRASGPRIADDVGAGRRPPVRIAACLPPLVGSYRPDTMPDEAVALGSWRRIVALQADACDLVLCETMGSIAEAVTAARAGLESGLPVWVGLTVDDDRSGRLRSGEGVAEAVRALEALGVGAGRLEAILLNCSTPEAIDAAWPGLAGARATTGAYANAFTSVAALEPGGTVAALERREDLGPEPYAARARAWLAAGAGILGGCCETTPAHVRALASLPGGAQGPHPPGACQCPVPLAP